MLSKRTWSSFLWEWMIVTPLTDAWMLLSFMGNCWYGTLFPFYDSGSVVGFGGYSLSLTGLSPSLRSVALSLSLSGMANTCSIFSHWLAQLTSGPQPWSDGDLEQVLPGDREDRDQALQSNDFRSSLHLLTHTHTHFTLTESLWKWYKADTHIKWWESQGGVCTFRFHWVKIHTHTQLHRRLLCCDIQSRSAGQWAVVELDESPDKVQVVKEKFSSFLYKECVV